MRTGSGAGVMQAQRSGHGASAVRSTHEAEPVIRVG